MFACLKVDEVRLMNVAQKLTSTRRSCWCLSNVYRLGERQEGILVEFVVRKLEAILQHFKCTVYVLTSGTVSSETVEMDYDIIEEVKNSAA